MLPGTAEETAKSALPYLPEPFPDELFGSWLSRLVYLNAESSLASFAQTYKLKANIKSPLADPLNGANYVFALSNLLGFEYADFVTTFTTKPYWDAFKAIELKKPSVSGFHGRRRALPTLRICPACVEFDMQTFGCSYFHRAHQLHSKACPVHMLILQDSCGKCGAPLRSSFMEVTLIPATCKCGAEIIPNLAREPANELWTALAIFASQALVAPPGELDLHYLAPYIFSFFEGEADISTATAMKNILSSSYGADGLDWLYWRRSTQTIKQSPIEQAHWTKNLEPHIAAAVLVAHGITFDDAKQEVAYQKSLPLRQRRGMSRNKTASKEARPSTVSEARQIAEQFGQQHKQRSALRAIKTYAYWILYFQDHEWLWDWAHKREMRSAPKWIEPPDINADRDTIRGTSSAFKRHMARARAYARDRDWLDHNNKTLRPKNNSSENKILAALSAARDQHFAEKSRPVKWTVTLAARSLRMPVKTLHKFIRRNGILRKVIPESPYDFRSRLIEWGITECIRQGRQLTASQVQRSALLPGQTPYNIIETAIARRLRS